MQKTAWIRVFGAGAAVLSMLIGNALAGPLASPGCQAGGEAATVASVDAALHLHLADGRVVRVAGLQTEPAASGVPTAAVADWLDGATVDVVPVLAEPDRWGRTVALVFAPTRDGSGHPVSVGEAMLDAGLAALQPDPGLDPCWSIYLELEQDARQHGAGRWAGGAGLVDPTNHDALLRALGSWTLVEGRVSAVHEGHSRTYLRLAGAASGFAVTVDHATLQRLGRSFGPASQWVGRRLLARGLLDDRWGLQIDVSSPQQLSLSPADSTGAAAFR